MIDTDLARLALDAAMEADDILAGRSHTDAAISSLRDTLGRATAIASSNGRPASYLSPSSARAFRHAVTTYSGEPIGTTDDLLHIMQQLVTRLNSFMAERNHQALEGFVEFCLALNEDLTSRRQALLRARRSKHSYRH